MPQSKPQAAAEQRTVVGAGVLVWGAGCRAVDFGQWGCVWGSCGAFRPLAVVSEPDGARARLRPTLTKARNLTVHNTDYKLRSLELSGKTRSVFKPPQKGSCCVWSTEGVASHSM